MLTFVTSFLASADSAAILSSPGYYSQPEFCRNSKVKRNLFGLISTDMPSGLTRGQVADGAPPVSSFFQGMKPSVSRTLPNHALIQRIDW